MKKQNIRTLSLIICTLTYLLVGAAIFDALESEYELRQRELVTKMKGKFMNKYNVTEVDYRILETIIVKSIPHKAGYQWKFAGSLFFCTTVISTIGYGHSTPATIGGKSFCMFYALAGIPLTLVMFQSIGERLNTLVRCTLKQVKRGFGARKQGVSQTNLIMAASTVCTLVMTAGAYAFHCYEGWDYLDSLYYCFITLTTIGFGDYVALQKDGALQNKPQYVVFSLIFIIFGLTVVSAAMNLLVLRFLTMNTQDEQREEREARRALEERGHSVHRGASLRSILRIRSSKSPGTPRRTPNLRESIRRVFRRPVTPEHGKESPDVASNADLGSHCACTCNLAATNASDTQAVTSQRLHPRVTVNRTPSLLEPREYWRGSSESTTAAKRIADVRTTAKRTLEKDAASQHRIHRSSDDITKISTKSQDEATTSRKHLQTSKTRFRHPLDDSNFSVLRFDDRNSPEIERTEL